MEINSIKIPTSATIVIDKKGNVISKQINFADIPLTDSAVLKLIEMLGWDLKNNQPITWK